MFIAKLPDLRGTTSSPHPHCIVAVVARLLICPQSRHWNARLRGRRLEYFTVVWNTLEGLVAVVAGIVAGSISLVGFGIDSFIEVTSGSVLLWRMSVDSDVHRRPRNREAGFAN